jgi:mannose-6-phosphate isomerase-like protein (cupin superfamily)
MYVLRADDPANTAIWTDQMRGGYATWQSGFECDYHCHQGADEVFVFLDGQCEITVEGETRLCGPGETVYTRAGQLHKLKAVGPDPLVMFIVVAPNHSPTHTIHHADGRIQNTDRTVPDHRIP